MNAVAAFFLVSYPNFFPHLEDMKTTTKKKPVQGEWTARSPSLNRKGGWVTLKETQLTSTHYNCSLVLLVAVQLHWDRWGLSCFAEGYFSSSRGLESTYHTIPLPRHSQRVLSVKPLTFWSSLLQCCCLKQTSRMLHLRRFQQPKQYMVYYFSYHLSTLQF